MSKNFCTVHHFYHESMECPLCQQERIKALAAKYETKNVEKAQKPIKKVKENKTRSITAEDLDKLVSKFNHNK